MVSKIQMKRAKRDMHTYLHTYLLTYLLTNQAYNQHKLIKNENEIQKAKIKDFIFNSTIVKADIF